MNDGRITFDRSDDLLDCVAKAVADGKVVGWFQGRSEFGPRALGSRSILAHPGLPDMADRVNSKVKFREKFRPFAPTVLAEEADKFLVPMAARSLYMSFAQPVIAEHRRKLPAVTHVDGTARLQYLQREENPRFYDLIKRFMLLAGLPMILNTSFNVQGEPIVETPDDAIWTFLNSDMDALAMGPFWVQKKAFPSDKELACMTIIAERDVSYETVSHPGGAVDRATIYVRGRAFESNELAVAVLDCCGNAVSFDEIVREISEGQGDMREALVASLRELYRIGAVRIERGDAVI